MELCAREDLIFISSIRYDRRSFRRRNPCTHHYGLAGMRSAPVWTRREPASPSIPPAAPRRELRSRQARISPSRDRAAPSPGGIGVLQRHIQKGVFDLTAIAADEFEIVDAERSWQRRRKTQLDAQEVLRQRRPRGKGHTRRLRLLPYGGACQGTKRQRRGGGKEQARRRVALSVRPIDYHYIFANPVAPR